MEYWSVGKRRMAVLHSSTPFLQYSTTPINEGIDHA
jgi:hypothetical protein